MTLFKLNDDEFYKDNYKKKEEKEQLISFKKATEIFKQNAMNMKFEQSKNDEEDVDMTFK